MPFTEKLAEHAKNAQTKLISISANRLTEKLLSAAREEGAQIFEKQKSHPLGLSEHEAGARLRYHGENKPIKEKKKSKIMRFFEVLNNPLNFLLIILAIVSYFTGDSEATIIIAVMLSISIALRFIQEIKADDAAEKLKAMVRTTVTVMREGKKKEIPLLHVVPGDVVLLSAGDIVPADVRLISSKDLFINQATLTGESLPAEKHAQTIKEGTNPLEMQNLCFMGTNVESGTATAVVIFTGADTYFGSLAKSIVSTENATGFDKGINSFTWTMIMFMLVMVPLVFFINLLTKHDFLSALLFALSVAVGLTPEMLPMIVTVNLSKGAISMSEKKVIVKRLNAIQNFGAMDVLCTDKTGTLTQGRVILEKHIDIHGHESEEILDYAFLNSYHQTGLKNIIDVAVLEHVEVGHKLDVEKAYKKVDEVPFDFVRKRMSVVVEDQKGRETLICKGAVEDVMSVCTNMEIEGRIVTLRHKIETEIAKGLVRALNEDGFRVIAIAYKKTPPTAQKQKVYSVKDEVGLTLIGFVAFLDPPKESSKEAIQKLNENGVEVKVLTGDNEAITKKICEEVGLRIKGILLGNQIEVMDEEKLMEAADGATIFAKLSPTHKERIVRALQKRGHVVGFMGDGINDAPALRAADVGISVDTAVDIAKESSSIILLEKSLLVLEEGVLEGRKVFGNITKYVKMAASSNFGNMFSVIGASFLLPFLPMLPLQVLINNLLYDFSQTAIPYDNVDKEWLAKPRKWNMGAIQRFIVFIGPISSIFDYTTFAMMIFVFGAWTNASLFHTGWFVESLLTQTLIIHIIRTDKIPFIQSRASFQMIVMTLLVMSIGIWLPYSPFAEALGFVPLPPLYWVLLFATLLCYMTLTQFVKTWFIKRFGDPGDAIASNGNGGNGSGNGGKNGDGAAQRTISPTT